MPRFRRSGRTQMQPEGKKRTNGNVPGATSETSWHCRTTAADRRYTEQIDDSKERRSPSCCFRESKEQFAVDPNAVWQFAETASWVLMHAPLSSRALNAKVRAAAYMGNALRANGDLAGADRFLAQARQLIRSEGVISTEIYAEVDLLEGGLRKDQRRLKEAEVLLSPRFAPLLRH